MGQYCFARGRLSSVVVCNAAGERVGRRAHGRSGGRHCTAGQYGYAPLGRHLVSLAVSRRHLRSADRRMLVLRQIRTVFGPKDFTVATAVVETLLADLRVASQTVATFKGICLLVLSEAAHLRLLVMCHRGDLMCKYANNTKL